MRVGNLVIKRWGRIDPWQKDAIGVVVGEFSTFTGQFLIVTYPGKTASLTKGVAYRSDEFETISERR